MNAEPHSFLKGMGFCALEKSSGVQSFDFGIKHQAVATSEAKEEQNSQ